MLPEESAGCGAMGGRRSVRLAGERGETSVRGWNDGGAGLRMKAGDSGPAGPALARTEPTPRAAIGAETNDSNRGNAKEETPDRSRRGIFSTTSPRPS